MFCFFPLLCTPPVRKLQLYWFWRQNIIMNIGTKQEHIVHRTINVYFFLFFCVFCTYSYCNEMNVHTICWFFNKSISCARSIPFKIVGIILSLQFNSYIIMCVYKNSFFLLNRFYISFVAAIEHRQCHSSTLFSLQSSVLRLKFFVLLQNACNMHSSMSCVCVSVLFFFISSSSCFSGRRTTFIAHAFYHFWRYRRNLWRYR